MFSQTMCCSLTYINVKKVNSLIAKKKQKNTHTKRVQAISSDMISAMFCYSTIHHMYLFSMRTVGIAFVAPTVSTLSLSHSVCLCCFLIFFLLLSFKISSPTRTFALWYYWKCFVTALFLFFYLAWGFDSRHCWLFTVCCMAPILWNHIKNLIFFFFCTSIYIYIIHDDL